MSPENISKAGKGQRASAVEGSEAQGVLKQIAPGLEQRSSWSKAAAKKLQIYTCSALQLQALEEPSAQGRVEGSSLLICTKVPYRLAAALRGRIRPEFHLSVSTCQLSRRDPRSN